MAPTTPAPADQDATRRVAVPVLSVVAVLLTAGAALSGVQRAIGVATGVDELRLAVAVQGYAGEPEGYRFTEFAVALTDVTSWPRTLLIVGGLLTAGAWVVLGLLLLRYTRRLERGQVFPRAFARVLTVSAIAVGAFGVLLTDLGEAAARVDLQSAGVEIALGHSSSASPWPWVGAAIALGTLALAYRRGERLQRDTEGLV